MKCLATAEISQSEIIKIPPSTKIDRCKIGQNLHPWKYIHVKINLGKLSSLRYAN